MREGKTIEGISELICDDAGKELERCRKYVETFLWDEKEQCYLFNRDTPVLMADAFVANAMYITRGCPGQWTPENWQNTT